MAILYSNADDLRNSGLVHVETQDGGGAAFTPTTTAIPSGYRDILISGNIYSTTATSNGEYIHMYLNGDTTDNHYLTGYFWHEIALYGGNQFTNPALLWAMNSVTAGVAGADGVSSFTATIADYGNAALQATAAARRVVHFVPTPYAGEVFAGMVWIDSTDAVTSVLLSPAAGSFAAGSSFTVWVR